MSTEITDSNFNERADDILALLTAAAEMVKNSKSKPLLTLRGTRMREIQP